MIRGVDCGELKDDIYVDRPLCNECLLARPKYVQEGEFDPPPGPSCDGYPGRAFREQLRERSSLEFAEAYYRYKTRWWNR